MDCVHQDDVDSERTWLIYPLYIKLMMKKESFNRRLKSCGAFTEVNLNLSSSVHKICGFEDVRSCIFNYEMTVHLLLDLLILNEMRSTCLNILR